MIRERRGDAPRPRFPMVVKLMLSYLFLLIIPFVATNVLLSHIAENNIYDNTVTYVNLFVDQVSAGIDSYVGELDHMVRVLILDERLSQILSEEETTTVASYESALYVDSCMLKLMTQHGGIDNVAVIGSNGRVFTCDSNAIRDMDVFREITRIDDFRSERYGLAFSGTHIPSYFLISPSEPVFCMMRNLYQFNRYIGTVILFVDQKKFLESVNIAPPKKDIDARIRVLNDRGETLLDGMLREVSGEGMDPQDDPASPTNDGQEALQFQRRSDYSGLTTTVSIGREALFCNIRTFRNLAMGITIAIIPICLLLSLWFSLKLMRPITALTHANEEYASGNYDVRVPVTTSDEIGTLCRSFNDMAEDLNTLMHRVYLYQIKTEETQLKALQAQINPHFLHNTLESIRMQALINGDIKTANMIKMLAQLFRITLDNKHNMVTVREELDHTQLYIALQNVRFNNRFRMVVDVPPELESAPMLKFTLQPLVENSMMHGFRNKTRDDETIWIRIREQENIIRVEVSDNGEGIDADQLRRIREQLNAPEILSQASDTSTGIGLANIAGRLRLHYIDR